MLIYRMIYPNAFEKFVNVAVNATLSAEASKGVVENISERLSKRVVWEATAFEAEVFVSGKSR